MRRGEPWSPRSQPASGQALREDTGFHAAWAPGWGAVRASGGGSPSEKVSGSVYASGQASKPASASEQAQRPETGLPPGPADKCIPVPRLRPEKAPDKDSQPKTAQAPGLQPALPWQTLHHPAGKHPLHPPAEQVWTGRTNPDTDPGPQC